MKYNRIGLTGVIASGKSLVGKMLRERGYWVIDTDQTAREVVAPGTIGLQRIEEHFPGVVKHGILDRKALGAIVFSDEEKRKELNALLHPLIRERLLEQMQGSSERIFVEAPLLFESDLDEDLDLVIEVRAPHELIMERLMKRERIDEKKARERLASFHDTGKRGDFILYNDGDIAKLEEQVEAMLAWIKSREEDERRL